MGALEKPVSHHTCIHAAGNFYLPSWMDGWIFSDSKSVTVLSPNFFKKSLLKTASRFFVRIQIYKPWW